MVVIAIFRVIKAPFIDGNLSIIDCYAEAVHVFRNFVHVIKNRLVGAPVHVIEKTVHVHENCCSRVLRILRASPQSRRGHHHNSAVNGKQWLTMQAMCVVTIARRWADRESKLSRLRRNYAIRSASSRSRPMNGLLPARRVPSIKWPFRLDPIRPEGAPKLRTSKPVFLTNSSQKVKPCTPVPS